MTMSRGVEIYIYQYTYIHIYIHILLRIKLSKRQALYSDTLWYPCVKGTISGNHYHDTTVSDDSDVVIYIYIYIYIYTYILVQKLS